ncbi:type 2 lanthipeptide synthetase LanM family protein [Streptomyces sp. ML-6]|uniref:type 2 lanthipeptide synthetase LanM family protein n=1 Tax=Streptomyces sp. ML-6 TaxID=2982693 RepID=UPI0024C00B02|nr:type 2 lanthipeptide synthetase LanM family protein [Streptomyces sp. ML-6]MDK0519564.1 type 2 lanthipeptide synthetase LanM family protein [Streptomyces sp. ML-6]
MTEIDTGADERLCVSSASRPSAAAGHPADAVGLLEAERPSMPAASGPPGPPGVSWADDRWWRPALTEERSRARTPDWALFVQDAVSAAPERAEIADGEDRPGLRGFECVLAPFTACAARRMLDGLPPRVGRCTDLDAVRDDFERHLARRLARLAARTLVLELHTARRGGRLAGAAPEDRFTDFLRLTGSRSGLAALCTAYPVLARILARAALDAAAALTEMLVRFAADRPVLPGVRTAPGGTPSQGASSGAGAGAGRLVGVVPGAGDGHRGGRTVMLLRFEDGARLVYKPRPLAAHRHFNELVQWFNALPGTPGLRTLALLDRGSYGWVEFVAERPCRSARQVEVFYRRQGALLALLHALDGTDLHHENLIADGEHPVLVDVETLFHPPLPAAGSDDPAARALHDSVHRVGLLPQLLVGDETALDMSGIGGGQAAESPVRSPDWADAGTDRMRLVRRTARFGESANRPRLTRTPADPSAFTRALCAGFRAGYTAIKAARTELLCPGGLLERFAHDEVRVVARPTWVYSSLLDESTHPDLMRDAAERHEVLALLGTDVLGSSALPGLLDEEIAQLWAGDVPLFTALPERTDLWGGNGRLLPGTLARTGLSLVREKLAAMDTVDRQDQERIIRAAMVTTSREPAHSPGPGPRRARTAATAPEPEQLLAAARSVGDQLVSQAYSGPTRLNWIGLELLGERYWRLGPMAADVAGGYTGTACFLAQLASLTGADRYAAAARDALAPLAGLLDSLHARPDDLGPVGSGAFAGLGGIAYVLAQVSDTLDDPRLGELVLPALRLTGAAASAESEYGVRGGTAGGLVGLLAGYRTTGRADVWRGAERCAGLLREAPLPDAPGFADGSAGIGWALLRFAEAGGGEPYRASGLAALRAATGAVGPDVSWCRGRTGVALAVLDSPAARADPALSAWAREAAADIARSEPPPDDSLCHGELGVLELLRLGEPSGARTRWVERAGALLAAADRAKPRCGTPGQVPHPGLLTGLAGIGHGLLRAGFPDRVPSLLLLAGPTAPVTPASSH